MTEQLHDPAHHYDRVTAAWTLLLGEDLHYGVFKADDEELARATQRLTEMMAEAAALEPGMRVLDVGCGTGAPACYIAERHRVRVTAITTSEAGVTSSRERVAAANLERLVDCELRDATAPGFHNQTFDRIWVLESAHLIRDRRRLLEECARLLSPEGRLVLCDIVLRRQLPLLEVRRLLGPLMLLRGVFGDAKMETLEWYRGMISASGFNVDLERDLTEATRPTFARWRANAKEHRRALIELLGAPELERFVDACDVLDHLWADGTLGYGMIGASRG